VPAGIGVLSPEFPEASSLGIFVILIYGLEQQFKEIYQSCVRDILSMEQGFGRTMRHAVILKDAIEGSMRMKRMLEQDEDDDSAKKAKSGGDCKSHQNSDAALLCGCRNAQIWAEGPDGGVQPLTQTHQTVKLRFRMFQLKNVLYSIKCMKIPRGR